MAVTSACITQGWLAIQAHIKLALFYKNSGIKLHTRYPVSNRTSPVELAVVAASVVGILGYLDNQDGDLGGIIGGLWRLNGAVMMEAAEDGTKIV